MYIILNNLIELRNAIITIDNMLTLTYEKIKTNDYSQTINTNLVKTAKFDVKSQRKIDIPVIDDDVISPLGKSSDFEWKDNNNKIFDKETIFYNKYLKYKQKYYGLKNNN